MLDTPEAEEFRKNKHRVQAYVKGQLDMSGPSVSGVMTGVQQKKIMEPVLEDPLYKHVHEHGYDSKPFPTTEETAE